MGSYSVDSEKLGLPGADSCSGCMACVDSCPSHALQGYFNRVGHRRVRVDWDLCRRCGKCRQVCPVSNHFDYRRKDGSPEVYAVWHRNPLVRKKSASGGAAAGIAEAVLKAGGCAVGAVMNGSRVEYRMIDDLKDLEQFQGSKYLPGDTQGIYLAVQERLKRKQSVFFCGLPCQTAGLLSFLGKDAADEHLITGDLICGGLPSILPMRMIEKYYPQPLSSVTFRDKEDGWNGHYVLRFATSARDNRRTDEASTFYYTCMNFTRQPSCFNCRFAVAPRCSDFTFADYWGVKKYPEQNYDGISIAVANSPRALFWLNGSDLERHRESWSDFLPFNFRMTVGESGIDEPRTVFERIFPWMLKFNHAGFLPGKLAFKLSALEARILIRLKKIFFPADTLALRAAYSSSCAGELDRKAAASCPDAADDRKNNNQSNILNTNLP